MEEHSDRPPTYKSYWLRCWPGGVRQPGGSGKWRFSLEDPVTGEKKGFSDMKAILAFVELELDRLDPRPTAESDSDGLNS